MTEPLVIVDDLSIKYGSAAMLPRSRSTENWAVRKVSFEIHPGETLGLVGESGSGKSSIGQALLGNVRPTAGTLSVGGYEVHEFGRRVPRAYRWVAQVVWQDPYRSLTPTMCVGDQIGEPIRNRFGRGRVEAAEEVGRLLQQVGLDPQMADELPHRFSGGQRQRIAIARAVAAQPQLIILDEPVSALDAISQAQIIQMLESLQRDTGVAFLLISHDLAVVRHMADRTAVLCGGRLVEQGGVEETAGTPLHPYTEELLASVLDTTPQRGRRHTAQQPVPRFRKVESPDICPYLDRCWTSGPECEVEEPPMASASTGHLALCHHPIRTTPSSHSAVAALSGVGPDASKED